jgi:hypothetical protein
MPVRLLCDAIPFCYGPAAALDSLLGALFSMSSPPLQVDILASGSTLELLARAAYPVNLLSVDSEDSGALAGVPFASYDAFINVCNPASYRFAKAAGVPTAYLDFLLWMHIGSAPDYFGADLYLAENYPGTKEWIARRGNEIANLSMIPPLVRPSRRRTPIPGSLLVGLGGLFSRLTIPGENTNYAPLIMTSLLSALPPGRFSRVVIAGPALIAPLMDELIADRPGVAYVSLSHEGFLEALTNAELFVSHPGLYAAFEGMLRGVPTAFLPPSNYTQVLQLRHYRTLGLAQCSFSWEDAGLDAIPDSLPESDGVHAVLSLLAKVESSPRARWALRAFMTDFFNLAPTELAALGERQRRLVTIFGCDGPRIAAQRFLEWLRVISAKRNDANVRRSCSDRLTQQTTEEAR